MKALIDKLNSRRGASILIALLFMLVCMLVGSSVVLAAATNAGKTAGRKEEQQKYLTVSSALTLVCDELQNMRYVGHYSSGPYNRNEAPPGNGREAREEASGIEYEYYFYTFVSEEGELVRKDDNSSWTLGGVLPLGENLDYAVSQLFANKTGGEPVVGDRTYGGHQYRLSDVDIEWDPSQDDYVRTERYSRYEWSGHVAPAAAPDASYTVDILGVDGMEGKVRIEVAVTCPALTGEELPEPIGLDLTATLMEEDDGDPPGYASTGYVLYAHLDSVGALKAPEWHNVSGFAGYLDWELKFISKFPEGGGP